MNKFQEDPAQNQCSQTQVGGVAGAKSCLDPVRAETIYERVAGQDIPNMDEQQLKSLIVVATWKIEDLKKARAAGRMMDVTRKEFTDLQHKFHHLAKFFGVNLP